MDDSKSMDCADELGIINTDRKITETTDKHGITANWFCIIDSIIFKNSENLVASQAGEKR